VRRVAIVANVLTAALLAVACAVLACRFLPGDDGICRVILHSGRARMQTTGLPSERSLEVSLTKLLPEVEFGSVERTLVMVLSTSCR